MESQLRTITLRHGTKVTAIERSGKWRVPVLALAADSFEEVERLTQEAVNGEVERIAAQSNSDQ